MTLRGTNPASYITEYTLVYEDKAFKLFPFRPEADRVNYFFFFIISSLELSDTKVYEPYIPR